MMNIELKNLLIALAILGFASFNSPLQAAPEVKLSNWVEEIKIGGDLRIRYEDFHKTSGSNVDRSRQRFRLRINTDFKLPYNLFGKLTFASGTGEQVSTNQSFDNLSSQKTCTSTKPMSRGGRSTSF
jgi:hypothetical protein